MKGRTLITSEIRSFRLARSNLYDRRCEKDRVRGANLVRYLLHLRIGGKILIFLLLLHCRWRRDQIQESAGNAVVQKEILTFDL
jgi:hypothetical protein